MHRTSLLIWLVCLVLPAVAGAQTTVSIVKGDDPEKMVAEALGLIGGLKGIVKDGDTVVIKPNLVTPDTAVEPGLMTDVRVVEALVKQIRAVAKCRIILAEGGAPEPEKGRTTRDAFRLNGYMPLVEKHSVEIRDLNEDKRIAVEIKGLSAYPKYEMPETIMTCSVLIDVPLLKTHNLAGVTVGMKNLFGLIPPPRGKYHSRLSGVLCDLVRMRKPDLVLVDGIVGTEGEGPLSGRPKRMDLVLAGRDVVAVDAVAASVMGYDPRGIRHIRFAGRDGLGTSDLSKIAVVGRSIAEVKSLFAYAHREEWMSCPRTDELVRRVLLLSDSNGPVEWQGKIWGRWARFKADELRPDPANPLWKPTGFSVYIETDGKEIEFAVPYEAAIDQNAPAARAEMKRWVKQKLGVEVKEDPDAQSKPTAKLW